MKYFYSLKIKLFLHLGFPFCNGHLDLTQNVCACVCILGSVEKAYKNTIFSVPVQKLK